MNKARIDTNIKHEFTRINNHEWTRIKTRGQAVIEYAVVIVCVITALLAIQFYLQRAYQGRLRSAADQMGEQYDPGKMSGSVTTTVNKDILTEVVREEEPNTIIDGKPGFGTYKTETINQDETTRQGSETVAGF